MSKNLVYTKDEERYLMHAFVGLLREANSTLHSMYAHNDPYIGSSKTYYDLKRAQVATCQKMLAQLGYDEQGYAIKPPAPPVVPALICGALWTLSSGYQVVCAKKPGHQTRGVIVHGDWRGASPEEIRAYEAKMSA